MAQPCSWCPPQEVGQQSRARGRRSLGMELRTAVEAAAHDGAERLAVHGDGRRVEAHRGGVAMHEIGRAAVIDALQQRLGIGGCPERVPDHVRPARALYRPHRSEERRGGTECVSTRRSRWAPYQLKKTKKTKQK